MERVKYVHYVCPFSPFLNTGLQINQWLKLPAYRIIVDSDECTEYKKCNKQCLMLHDVSSMVKEGKLETTECMSCRLCVEACQFDALKSKWARP